MSRYKELLKRLEKQLDYSTDTMIKIIVAMNNHDKKSLKEGLDFYDEVSKRICLIANQMQSTRKGHISCTDPYCKICPHSPKWVYDRT